MPRAHLQDYFIIQIAAYRVTYHPHAMFVGMKSLDSVFDVKHYLTGHGLSRSQPPCAFLSSECSNKTVVCVHSDSGMGLI